MLISLWRSIETPNIFVTYVNYKKEKNQEKRE